MDRIWNPQSWPKPQHRRIKLIEFMKSIKFKITPFCYSSKFMEYLMHIWESEKVPISTLQLTLSIASRFSQKNSRYSQSTQLILLVSLFLASKTLDKDSLPVSQIHKLSNHSFTNKDIYRTEQRILLELNFKLMDEGICNHHVMTLLRMIDPLCGGNTFSLLSKICSDLQAVVFFSLFTSEQKIEEKYLEILPAAIVQIALILATKCSGRFPSTVWMIHCMGFTEDDLNNFVEILMKIIFGKQKVHELKI